MLKSDSLIKLAPALLAAQKKLGAAVKDSKNPFFKSSYADLNAVIDASVDTLNANDIAVLQATTTENGKSVLQTVLLHTSGEYIGSSTDIVAAKANDPQAYGSAVSYARRYGLQALVTLKASDDDGEAAMGRGKTSWTPKTTGATMDAAKIATPETKPAIDEKTTTVSVAPKKVSFSRKSVTT